MTIPDVTFWNIFKSTKGALSCAEALCIMQIAELAPKGKYIELGTHKGKSAIAAVQSLKDGRFFLVEPEFKDADWKETTTLEVMLSAVNEIDVIPIADYSYNVIDKHSPYSYVFVDSGIHDDLVREESRQLEDQVVRGGIIAYHDYLNQFTAVERAFNYMLSTGKFQKIEIDWESIFDYVVQNDLEKDNSSWHQYPELPHPPNFVGALIRL